MYPQHRYLSFLALLPLAAALTANLSFSEDAHNVLSASEQRDGWTLLFDGKTLSHWNDPSKLNPAGDAWTIEDGCIKTIPRPQITEDLVSAEKYRDFELDWQWRISPGGNSGVKYRIQKFVVLTSQTKGPAGTKFEDQVKYAAEHNSFDRSSIGTGMKAQIYVVGFEYQMIDNARHPDAQRGPLYQSAALYGILPADKDVTKPVGDFNQSRLIVRGRHFEHWLNGVKIVDQEATPELLTHALAKRWGESSPAFELLRDQPAIECPISLQNHGDQAWFRDIRIKRL